MLKWNPATEMSTPFTRSPGRKAEENVLGAAKVLRERPETVAPAIAEALERPEVREQVARNMGNAELAGVVETAARVGRDRGHAERAERDGRDRGPTIDDVAPGETREELEASVTQWIDDALIRVYYRTGELYRTFQKYGGNTGMDRGEAIEKLREAERMIAEMAVALEERERDEKLVRRAVN